MYQRYSDVVAYRQGILDDLYDIIGKSIDKGLYAFKGGYVLSKKIKFNLRRTNDIDMTILNTSTFYLVVSSVRDYVVNLLDKGIIWGWDIQEPRIEGSKNVSGYIKLFVKESANTKKITFCGVDISIHELGEGVELGFHNYACYSDEYMLADKISALYGTERNVLRRIRDIFDIYLILSNKNSVNNSLVLKRLEGKGKNINISTTLEVLLKSNASTVVLRLDEFISSGTRVDYSVWSSKKVSTKDVILVVCKYISYLRRMEG